MKEVLKSLLSDFDPASLIPELSEVMGYLEITLRLLVLVGPLCLLGLGLWYLLAPAKEANHSVGYRFYWGMSSVESWQFTQRLAGIVWTGLGLGLTVAMAVICNGYRDLSQEAMVWSALKCLGWELGLIVVSILAIDITVLVLFDRKGCRRQWKKAEKAE